MTVTSPDNSTAALFAGSFNPFTVGHASIVERGLAIFRRIVIAIGINIDKPDSDIEARKKEIEALYADEPRVEVVTFTGLAVDAARDNGATVLLRGVRTLADFEYERSMADVNMRLSGIDTVFLTASPDVESVSSSMVRELKRFGADVSAFLPPKKKTL